MLSGREQELAGRLREAASQVIGSDHDEDDEGDVGDVGDEYDEGDKDDGDDEGDVGDDGDEIRKKITLLDIHKKIFQGDTSLVLTLLEDGAPFVVDSVSGFKASSLVDDC